MPLTLNELLPDEDYRFHLTLRRGNLPQFFSSPDPAVLRERHHWLSESPERFAGFIPGIEGAISEMEGLSAAWAGVATAGETHEAIDRVKALGSSLEPDFMLLTRDDAGVFLLRAGAVCFPSSWSLAEKMGRTLDEIHGHVPGLNPAIGGAIGQFLGHLKADAPFERANWGLAATPELNLHPSLGRPRLGSSFDSNATWLRIEDQIFAALPVSGAILFGIKIRIIPIHGILDDERLRAGFRRAMGTMSESLAAYKGLAGIRASVLAGV
ncbi:MAG TPA: heme-dependent oxidative N-demethylase subunit alpha family protein [Opitutaceae bacterium]|jgi:hypothetical protein|nr:heme-dependent oxidative N-demethylase subunit alpha family protein [Opitutaceae bacterium]